MAGNSLYPWLLAASLLTGALCFIYLARKAGLKPLSIWLTPPLAIGLGLLFARLFYVLARLEYVLALGGPLLDVAPKGLAFGGAVMGTLLAGWLAARLGRQEAHSLLNRLAPAAMLSLLLSRLAEYPAQLGQGAYVEEVAFQRFPLAVSNEYGEWYWAVCILEALFALLILLYLISRRAQKPGKAWQMALMLLMLCQIFSESLRAEALRWGFVRVHQLAAALGLGAMALVYAVKALKQGQPGKALAIPALVFLLGVALLIGIEFALDRWQQVPPLAMYAAMALVLAVMGMGIRRLYRLACIM